MAETTDGILESLRSKYDPTKKVDMFSVDLQDRPTQIAKPSFETYSMDTQDMAYDTLSDGSKVARYESYLPGSDNTERLAQQQTTGEKWSNGVIKALSKTGNAVLGGTVGVVYGLGAALNEGSFSAIYDNDFSNKLNDIDTSLNYQLPNYYTKQEQEKGLGGQMGTANFWADKFLGGLSFTAGAIISEAIWAAATGGTSLAARGAMLGTRLSRWGAKEIGEQAVLTGMSKYASTLKNLAPNSYKTGVIAKDIPNFLGKSGEVLSITGKLARSAGYEASVEALQFKKEAEENFYNNFSELNGRDPNSEDIYKFNQEVEGTANGVFATNMALLMPSNLITLGHVLDIKNPIKTGLSEFIDKKAFGYGLKKTAEGTFEKLVPTTAQKISRGIFNYAVKPGVTEGIFEEGGQGITNKVANKWIESTYDPVNTSETFDSIDSIGEAIAEQYTTKEGIVEVGLGVLIGMFGGATNVRGEQNRKEKELEFKASVGNTFGDQNLFAKNLINSKIQSSNRIAGFSKEAREEEAKGNVVNSQLAKKSAIISFINSKQILGESVESTVQEVKNSLDTLTTEQWAEAGVRPENIETEKIERLQEFESLSKQWKTNKTYWQYMLGGKLAGEQNLDVTGLEEAMGSAFFSKNAAIVEALAWQSTIGENAHSLMKDAQEVVGRELGTEQKKTITLIAKLKELNSIVNVNLDSLQKEYQANLAERDLLTKQIVRLNNAPKETQGDKVRGNELVKAQERLLEVQDKISAIQAEAQAVAEKINTTDTFRQNLADVDVNQDLGTSTISGSELLKLNENIEKFKGSLDFLRTSNPQRAQYLEDVMKEYEDAEKVFLQHQATQKIITSKDFKIERIEGWLRGKVKAKKAMNENTQEWLQDALQAYSENKAMFINDLLTTNNQQTTVSDEEYADFIDNGVVSQDILTIIAEKVKKQEPLDPKENAIFVSKTREINQIIAESTTKVEPKPQEQINQERIQELEAERRQKLSEVEDLVEQVRTEIEVELSEEDKKRLDSIPSEIQNLKNRIKRLTNEIESLNTPQDTDPIVDQFAKENNDEVLDYRKDSFQDTDVVIYQTSQPDDWSGKGSSFKQTWNVLKFNQGTYAHVRILMTSEQKNQYDPKAKSGFSKELRDLAKSNRDSDNVVLIDIRPTRYNTADIEKQQTLLKQEIENANSKIAQLQDTLERTKQKEGSSTKTIVTDNIIKNQAEIDRINREYDQKIANLRPETRTDLEIYKDLLEELLSKMQGVSYIPTTSEEAVSTKPTQEDIEKYREFRKDGKIRSKEYKELENKLKSWKMLSSVVDENYTSIAEIIDLIEQLETETQQETTKAEVTEDEAKTVLRDDTETGGKRYSPEYLQNQLGTVTVKNVTNTGKYMFSHVKMEYLVKNLNEDYVVTRKGKEVDVDLRDLKPGDIVYIGDMPVTFLAGGVLEMNIVDFNNSRQQSLNMYVSPVRTGTWTYLDVYTIKGNERVKMPSQFTENIQPEKTYDLKKGDVITAHIEGNRKEDDSVEKLKIYFKDSKGNNLSVAKAGREAKGDVSVIEYMNMRQVAYDRWVSAGKPDSLDLNISAEVDNIFFGSAELLTDENGRVVNVPITESETSLIVGKGYIQNGQFTLDIEAEDVNATFVGKLSKDNPSLKVPVIVFMKGVNKIAFPITMKKTNTPVEFDSILSSGASTQEIILAINEAILSNNINTPPLVFSDINNQQKLQLTREAFTNKQSFVSAEVLASSNYKKTNLANDALINIDLSNLDGAISSPKIRIDLDSIKLTDDLEFLEKRSLSLTQEMSNLADELYDKLYKSERVEAAKTNRFIDIIIDGYTEYKNGKSISYPPNRVAATKINSSGNKILGDYQADTALAYKRGRNILLKASEHLKSLDKEGKKVVTKEMKVKVENILIRYKQITPKKEDKKTGENNTRCPS